MKVKLEEIESLRLTPSTENLERLLVLLSDDDEEVRFRSIEALEDYPSSESLKAKVRNMFFDKDELVRATSIELIGEWQDTDSVKLLSDAMSDESQLVRSAAVLSLAQVGLPDTVALLRDSYSELRGLDLVSTAVALYALGEDRYLADALGCMSSPDYRVRCATANLLAGFVRHEHKGIAIEYMRKAMKVEETRAAASSISEAIKILEESD